MSRIYLGPGWASGLVHSLLAASISKVKHINLVEIPFRSPIRQMTVNSNSPDINSRNENNLFVKYYE